MPTRLTALTQATILGAADLLYAVVGGNSRAIPALAMAGRNRIINGTGRINQRVYVSGTTTTAANQYTLDRWRVVTSGQSLTFTGTDAGRIMTAPAGGVEQVIEGANIEGGTYVINWSGTASCTVNGTARAKGESFTLTAGANATVRFTSGTFTEVQLEAGTMATPFERMLFGDVLLRCQRYYCKSYQLNDTPGSVTNAGSLHIYTSYPTTLTGYFGGITVRFPVEMRVAPNITVFNPALLNTAGSFRAQNAANNPLCAITDIATSGALILANSATIQANDTLRCHYTAGAEL